MTDNTGPIEQCELCGGPDCDGCDLIPAYDPASRMHPTTQPTDTTGLIDLNYDRERLANAMFIGFEAAWKSDAGDLVDAFNEAKDQLFAGCQAYCPAAALATKDAPLDMLLWCPKCNAQHIDEPSDDWPNPPHRSHLCHDCGCIWRPADVPTNRVADVKTAGEADTWGWSGGDSLLPSLGNRLATKDAEIAAIAAALSPGLMMEVVDCGRWSLRFDFGEGDDACARMRAASDAVRTLLTEGEGK